MLTNWKSWRTSLFAFVTFALAVPAVASAIDAYVHHQPVDWRLTLVSLGLAASANGLFNAKDKQVSSTQSEVNAATADAAVKEANALAKATILPKE